MLNISMDNLVVDMVIVIW